MKSWKVLPTDLIDRLIKTVPRDKYHDALKAFSTNRPTTLRVNTLKTDVVPFKRQMKEKGVILETVPWYRQVFIVKNISLRQLQETEEYQKGFIYIQSLSSMVPVLLLDPSPGEKVLDATAAPGSKTTQMAAMMENKGKIVANDTSLLRLLRLRANLRNQGIKIAEVIQKDARNLWQEYPEYFDKVLCDVPCSMEGRISLKEPKSYRGWSKKKSKNLARLQKWILRSCISAAKTGGRIVYSTCTLSPEENEEVIEWILHKEKGNIILEKINLANFEFSPALTEWQDKRFDSEIAKTGRILPSFLMEGFYVAVLKKTRSNVKS